MTMTDDLRVRTAQLLHEAVDRAAHQTAQQRRSNYVAPRYTADMSVLNRFLDGLMDDMPEPPC